MCMYLSCAYMSTDGVPDIEYMYNVGTETLLAYELGPPTECVHSLAT